MNARRFDSDSSSIHRTLHRLADRPSVRPAVASRFALGLPSLLHSPPVSTVLVRLFGSFGLLGMLVVLAAPAWSADEAAAHSSRPSLPAPQDVVLVPREWPAGDIAAVTAGAEAWNRTCQAVLEPGALPRFWVGATPPGNHGIVYVTWNGGFSPVAGRCGRFHSNQIDLYELARDSTGRSLSCAPDGYAPNVAHELGHWLGLADEHCPACRNVMGQVGRGRRVTAEECRLAGSQNLTPNRRAAALAAAMSSAAARPRAAAPLAAMSLEIQPVAVPLLGAPSTAGSSAAPPLIARLPAVPAPAMSHAATPLVAACTTPLAMPPVDVLPLAATALAAPPIVSASARP